MAIEPIEPIESQTASPLGRLQRFATADAEQLAGWITERESYWLAPRSRPPLTARTVISWGETEGERFMLLDNDSIPIGYGEVNRLALQNNVYWLGHLIVNPQRRGQGYGRLLTRLLIDQALTYLAARRVTLVVFPENATAIACYEAAGMHRDGFETHFLPSYRRTVRLVRMAIER
jgi:RimJ/RimL family protein N-acetyltransferase